MPDELLGRVCVCPTVCAAVGGWEVGEGVRGQRLLKFNKASERMRRRTCLPLGAELCGQVQKS